MKDLEKVIRKVESRVVQKIENSVANLLEQYLQPAQSNKPTEEFYGPEYRYTSKREPEKQIHAIKYEGKKAFAEANFYVPVTLKKMIK